MKIRATLMIVAVAAGRGFATNWEVGAAKSHVLTDLPASIKEKMNLKYAKVEAMHMKKVVRLTGKIEAQSGNGTNFFGKRCHFYCFPVII